MNFINKIVLFAILIVLAVGGEFVYLNYKKVNLNPVEQKQQETTIIISDKKITDNTKPFNIEIIYPYVAGQDEFNKIVKDITDKEINDFKTNSLENDNAVKSVDPVDYAKFPREYDLQIGYDKGIVDENTISVVLNIYNFEGGAHGAEYSKSVNFNPKTKTEIKLADLFPNQPNYLKTISDFSITDLTKKIDPQMLDNSWIRTGAAPITENYSVFLINKNDITFYIQQYQVAAGAAGSFKVIFPK